MTSPPDGPPSWNDPHRQASGAWGSPPGRWPARPDQPAGHGHPDEPDSPGGDGSSDSPPRFGDHQQVEGYQQVEGHGALGAYQPPGVTDQPGGDESSLPGRRWRRLPADRPVPTYLWQSVVATLLCCLPSGVVAIVYATQAQGRLQSGNLAGALEASRKAKRWCVISAIAFVVVLLVYVVIIVIVVEVAAHRS